MSETDWREHFEGASTEALEMLRKYFSGEISLADLAEYSFTLAEKVRKFESQEEEVMSEIETATSMFTAKLLADPRIRRTIDRSAGHEEVDAIVSEMVEKGIINLTEMSDARLMREFLAYLEKRGGG